MLIGILLALIVVMVVVSVVTWIRRAWSCQRIVDSPVGELEQTWYGGVMCRDMMTSGTLVRLDLLESGLRMRGTPLARWYVPRWEASYDELALAELVATQHSRIAVWFRVQGEPGGMGFLSNWSRDILNRLQKHEVPVNRSVRQIRSAADMYPDQR